MAIDVDSLGIGDLYHFCEPYESSRKLLDHLLDSPLFKPAGVTDTLGTGRKHFLFRGHADVRWELLPTAHRGPLGQSSIAKLAPQAVWDPKKNDPRMKRDAFGGYLYEEVYGVRRFLETADKLGLPTPINFEHFRAQARTYKDLWDHKIELPRLDAFPDPELYPAFAMAQHYGVPTRFLDWTESPLVAAFFAAEGMWRAMRSEAAKPQSERASVAPCFAIVPMSVQFLEKKGVQIVHAPRVGNDFLRAQQGVFTLVPDANRWWWENDRWPSLLDLDISRFRPLVLPRSEAVPFLRLLFQLDVTHYHLMPTLHAAAEAVAYNRALFSAEALSLHEMFQ